MGGAGSRGAGAAPRVKGALQRAGEGHGKLQHTAAQPLLLVHLQVLGCQLVGHNVYSAPCMRPAWYSTTYRSPCTASLPACKPFCMPAASQTSHDIVVCSCSGMVRIYKHYDFQLASLDHKLRKMSFSSYPGELSSDDDFYLLDTGLAVLQTTNDILDTDLYKLLTPHSVLNWQRVR